MLEREILLKVHDLSKVYQIGEFGTGTISHDLNRWFNKVRGRDDLNKSVVADERKIRKINFVKALEGLDFEVKRGEVIGVVGKNGAGKSTLLKILSKVTLPTTGKVMVKGKIASLLEVGTGFHPELTGRENVYLNGAILGMKRSEISRKLEAIVDFAGVSKYLDTPVKRYSSGMTVRLGFAVAAHLEPDLLIVDEVLAVGDAEFQKKAVGKMQEVSQEEGRTVLIVSHNLATINELCNRSILLQGGRQIGFDDTKNILTQYIQTFSQEVESDRIVENQEIVCGNFEFLNEESVFDINTSISMTFDFKNKSRVDKLLIRFDLVSAQGIVICRADFKVWENLNREANRVTIEIPKRFLNAGLYNVGIKFIEYQIRNLIHVKDAFEFEVIPTSELAYSDIRDKNIGAVLSPLKIELSN